MPPLTAHPTCACCTLLRSSSLTSWLLPSLTPIPPEAMTAQPPEALPDSRVAAVPMHAAQPLLLAAVAAESMLSRPRTRVSCAIMTSVAERARA